MMRYPHIAQAFYNTPWYLRREKMEEIRAFLEPRLFGGLRFELADEQLAAWRTAREVQAARAAKRSSGSVAVIPIYGVITQRADSFIEASGGTSIEKLTRSFRQAVADPAVKAIVLDVDSPGGSVFGVDELASEILAARKQKKIIAQVNSQMASAAYYLGAAASEVVNTPSGEAGSIGTVTLHLDFSKQVETMGIKPTWIAYGKYKVEGNELEPLGADALAFWQQRVDEYGRAFEKSVARSRGVSLETVRKRFGQGRMFGAQEAKDRGLVDRIATLDQTLEGLGVNTGRAAVAAAAASGDRVAASMTELSDPQLWLEQLAIDQARLL